MPLRYQKLIQEHFNEPNLITSISTKSEYSIKNIKYNHI